MQHRSLETEAQFLKGVGPRFAKTLEKLGLRTVGDVLYHLPRRYEDRRHLPPISQLRAGQFATVKGDLMKVEARPTRGGMVILKALIGDKTGVISLTWFNQPWIGKQLRDYQGPIIAYGMVKEASFGLEISTPEWEMVDEDTDPSDFARIVPVYPATEGVGQKTLRKAAKSAVEGYLQFVEDPFPEYLRRQEKLQPLRWCLQQIHDPESDEMRAKARKRLVFEEFFYMQVALAMRRAETQQELGIAFPIETLTQGLEDWRIGGLTDANLTANPSILQSSNPATARRAVIKKPRHDSHLFESQQEALRAGEPLWDQIHRILPFELTGAQRRVIGEVFEDMKRPHPMNRLVQGDVGSGKTAVAAAAMLAAVRSGYQTALMAPTEILAEQHYANLRRLFQPLGIEVVLLVGKQTAKEKKKAQEQTASGQAKIAIGTHALIQEGVKFDRLGLVVVDEQHRFGVLQRAAMREKGLGNPDVLVMTATPIPRTLTMMIYGDLDLSVIDEMPPGRKPIKTHWMQPFKRASVYETVRNLIKEGRQAYFVCPMVSESEKMLTQAAEELHYRLSTGVFQDLRVGLLHGQLKSKEKEEAMLKFRNKEIDVLVSTTVIEVGVDVPNASIMVIEDANRFGLSQLHQLRGRVGRGEWQSFCVLVADAKTDDARARMDIMVSTTDGFKIAEEDLRLRGPGEIAGTKQSGNLDFKIADLVQDGHLLEISRQAAMDLIARDPQLRDPLHAGILDKIQERRSALAVVTIS
jgi:ATP-dependent DNA helicase RecG